MMWCRRVWMSICAVDAEGMQTQHTGAAWSWPGVLCLGCERMESFGARASEPLVISLGELLLSGGGQSRTPSLKRQRRSLHMEKCRVHRVSRPGCPWGLLRFWPAIEVTRCAWCQGGHYVLRATRLPSRAIWRPFGTGRVKGTSRGLQPQGSLCTPCGVTVPYQWTRARVSGWLPWLHWLVRAGLVPRCFPCVPGRLGGRSRLPPAAVRLVLLSWRLAAWRRRRGGCLDRWARLGGGSFAPAGGCWGRPR